MDILSYDDKTKILTSKELKIEIPPEGLEYHLYESMKKYSGKTAQLDIGTGEMDSFESLLERSVRCAVAMQNYGLQPGDIITICSYNQLDYGTTFLAATFLGAINANVDPSLSDEDLKYLLQLVTPKLMFVSEECEDLSKNIIEDLQLATKIIVYGDEFSKFIKPNVDDFNPYKCHNLNETIIIHFSSGTTDKPKAICLDHNYILYQTCRHIIPSFCFNNSTLYWISGTFHVINNIRYGTMRALCKKINFKLLWDRIEKYKIDSVMLPTYYVTPFVASKPVEHETNLKQLLFCGFQTSKENILKIKQKLPNTDVVTPYAMTELGCIAYPFDEISYNKHTSAGLLRPNLACKIVDPETEEPLNINQKGEIRIKSKHPFTGFYREPSKYLFDADGFYKTGDIGYLDEDFSFFVVDRIKSMFKYRENIILPSKIEKVLVNHPDVQKAVVIPIPHFEDCNHILAVVELKQKNNATEASIEKYCNDQLDDMYKIRAGVKILNAIPLTPTGKIARKALRDSILKELGCDTY